MRPLCLLPRVCLPPVTNRVGWARRVGGFRARRVRHVWGVDAALLPPGAPEVDWHPTALYPLRVCNIAHSYCRICWLPCLPRPPPAQSRTSDDERPSPTAPPCGIASTLTSTSTGTHDLVNLPSLPPPPPPPLSASSIPHCPRVGIMSPRPSTAAVAVEELLPMAFVALPAGLSSRSIGVRRGGTCHLHDSADRRRAAQWASGVSSIRAVRSSSATRRLLSVCCRARRTSTVHGPGRCSFPLDEGRHTVPVFLPGREQRCLPLLLRRGSDYPDAFFVLIPCL